MQITALSDDALLASLRAIASCGVWGLLVTLEKERLGATKRPQKIVRPSKAGHVSRSARREVFARDGERCTFADHEGNRCAARSLLELDHIDPRARGGGGEASNLRVRCRAHNRLHAEEIFGKAHVAERMDLRRTRSKRVLVARHNLAG